VALSEALVGRTLQSRQVEKQGRRLARLALLESFHPGAVRVRGRTVFPISILHRVGQSAVGEARGLAQGEGTRKLGATTGREFALEQPEILRHEGANLFLALDQNGQGRRLHPADGKQRRAIAPAVPDGHRPGGVQPHQPVGLGATAGRIGQGFHVAASPQRREAIANCLVGHRRDPQPPDGDAAVGELIDITKDELALAASVAGVDDLGEALVAQQMANRA